MEFWGGVGLYDVFAGADEIIGETLGTFGIVDQNFVEVDRLEESL